MAWDQSDSQCRQLTQYGPGSFSGVLYGPPIQERVLIKSEATAQQREGPKRLLFFKSNSREHFLKHLKRTSCLYFSSSSRFEGAESLPIRVYEANNPLIPKEEMPPKQRNKFQYPFLYIPIILFKEIDLCIYGKSDRYLTEIYKQ